MSRAPRQLRRFTFKLAAAAGRPMTPVAFYDTATLPAVRERIRTAWGDAAARSVRLDRERCNSCDCRPCMCREAGR